MATTVSMVVAQQRFEAERARARTLAVGAIDGAVLPLQPHRTSCLALIPVMIYRRWLIRHERFTFLTAFAGSLASYIVKIWTWRRAWERR